MRCIMQSQKMKKLLLIYNIKSRLLNLHKKIYKIQFI